MAMAFGSNAGYRQLPRIKNLLTRKVAHIFATERLLNSVLIFMRRDVFQAIADPTRREILTMLASRAMTPNALADNFHSRRELFQNMSKSYPNVN